MAAFPDFFSGFEVAQSPSADCQDLVNWYIESTQNLDTNRVAFYPTPGVGLVANGLVGGGRAHFAQNGREFAVIGTNLVQIAKDGTVTNRGTVGLDENPATISGNGDAGTPQLLITAGGNAYAYDITSEILTQISFFDGRALMCDFIDGYGLIFDPTTATVFISDLFDFTTWDPLQYIQNSATPDDWIAFKVANRLIYIFGSSTTQVWFNEGSFPIPFVLHPSGVMQMGIIARFSAEIVGTLLYWLGQTRNGSGSILRTGGFSPETVSTFALHNRFGTYPTLEDAVGDSYEDLGHTFYILTFPTANASWGFDPAMNSWARRGYWDSSMYAFVATRQLYHAYCFGEHRVLDPLGSGIYRLSSTFPLDVDGAAIRRMRITPVLRDENKLLRHSRFEIGLEAGLADVSGQGSNPVVMLQISNDGGKTFGVETFRGAGKRGEYSARVIWNRLGAGRQRVYKITVSDPVPWRITGAFITVGASVRR